MLAGSCSTSWDHPLQVRAEVAITLGKLWGTSWADAENIWYSRNGWWTPQYKTISTKLSFVVRDWALAHKINSVIVKPSKMKTGCMCVTLTCLEGSHQNSHPTCPTNSWWNHDEILVSLCLTSVHHRASTTLTSGVSPDHVTEAQGKMGGSMCLLFYAGACFLSLQVRTGLNQVVQVSSQFETCRNVVKNASRQICLR